VQCIQYHPKGIAGKVPNLTPTDSYPSMAARIDPFFLSQVPYRSRTLNETRLKVLIPTT
jgi:hypothetical protein